MKKFISFLLCTILLICGTLALVGCDKNNEDTPDQLETKSGLPNFEDCEIGYQMQFLHDTNFKYEYKQGNKSYIIEITSMSATLTEKNTINKGDIINDRFSPYVITFKITAKAPAELIGNNIGVAIGSTTGSNNSAILVTINENGIINSENILTNIKQNGYLFFIAIS